MSRDWHRGLTNLAEALSEFLDAETDYHDARKRLIALLGESKGDITTAIEELSTDD